MQPDPAEPKAALAADVHQHVRHELARDQDRDLDSVVRSTRDEEGQPSQPPSRGRRTQGGREGSAPPRPRRASALPSDCPPAPRGELSDRRPGPWGPLPTTSGRCGCRQ